MSDVIDLSRIPLPDAIETISHAELFADFTARFKAAWDTMRAADPTLDDYDTLMLEGEVVVAVGQTFATQRMRDRGRVNDMPRRLLAPLAKRADLDNIAAWTGTTRLVLKPADPQAGTPAVMESDASLLERHLLTFEAPAAGSAARYMLEARTAWPAIGDVAVIGHAIHGRRGDTDVVVAGPDGRDPTDAELAVVRAAVTAPNVAPEAVAVNVLRARRAVYAADLAVRVARGPSRLLVAGEAAARVRIAADGRMRIGAEVPPGLLLGAGFGDSVVAARDRRPVAIAADPYAIPVCTAVSVVPEGEE